MIEKEKELYLQSVYVMHMDKASWYVDVSRHTWARPPSACTSTLRDSEKQYRIELHGTHRNLFHN